MRRGLASTYLIGAFVVTFRSQRNLNTASIAFQECSIHCDKCGIKASAEAAGVEPAKPRLRFMDYKSSGLADARRFRTVNYNSQYQRSANLARVLTGKIKPR